MFDFHIKHDTCASKTVLYTELHEIPIAAILEFDSDYVNLEYLTCKLNYICLFQTQHWGPYR